MALGDTSPATQSRQFHIGVWSQDPFLALHVLASKIKFLAQPDHLTLHGINFSTTIDSAFDKFKGMRYMHNDEEWFAAYCLRSKCLFCDESASTLNFGLLCGHSFSIRSTVDLCSVRQYTWQR